MNFDATKTEYGVVIPKCAKFEKVQQTRSFMEMFENHKSYTQSRLKSLNVNLAVDPNIVMMGCRAGYNIKNDSTLSSTSSSTSSSSSSKDSFLFEQRMFELKMGNYREGLENSDMTFTKDFISDVEDLPDTYDKSDPDCKSEFERFFNRFGYFVVSSAYAGGTVEVKCTRKVDETEETTLADTKACLEAMLTDAAKANVCAGGSSSDDQKTKALLKRCTYEWEGGDQALHERETFKKWKASLLLNPTMLSSEMTLEPISTIVRCVHADKGKATYDALKDILGIRVEREEPSIMKALGRIKTRIKEKIITRLESLIEPNDDGSVCFPSSSVVNVQSKDGVIKQKKMANLDVGDKVMSWDEKRNRAIFTQVIMFAHHASEAMDVEYLKIVLEDGNKITLSGNHLVMVGEHKKAIMAQKVKPGDILFSVDENLEISPKKVLAVEKVIEQGVYCPITLHGNLIVDNVLASCYASVQDHVFFEGLVKISAQSIAHFGLMPMRALHKLRSKWLRKIPNGQTIHPYVQWLCKLNPSCMAN